MLKKWIFQNFKPLISFAILAIIILFFDQFLLTETGAAIAEKLMGQLPFIKYIAPLWKEVLKVEEGLETYTVNSTLFDLSKLLLSILLQALCYFVLLSIMNLLGFMKITDILNPHNQILALPTDLAISAAEGKMGSVIYRIQDTILTAVSSHAGLFASGAVITLLTTFSNGFTQGTLGSMTSLITFVVIYLAVSIIFSVVSGYSLSASIVKTAVFNLLPKIVTMFVQIHLIVFVYKVWKSENGIGWKTILAFFVLFVVTWLLKAVEEFLQKKLAGFMLRSGSIYGPLGTFLWLLSSLNFSLMFYILFVFAINVNGSTDNNFIANAILSLPFAQPYREGTPPFALFQQDLLQWGRHVLLLLLIAIMVSVLQMAFSESSGIDNIIADYFVWMLAFALKSVLIIVCYAILMFLENKIGIPGWLMVLLLGIAVLLIFLTQFYLAVQVLIQAAAIMISMQVLSACGIQIGLDFSQNDNPAMFLLVLAGILSLAGYLLGRLRLRYSMISG